MIRKNLPNYTYYSILSRKVQWESELKELFFLEAKWRAELPPFPHPSVLQTAFPQGESDAIALSGEHRHYIISDKAKELE